MSGCMANRGTPPRAERGSVLMSFPEWSEAIVAGMRRNIPDARAVRKGAGVVIIIRHGGDEAWLMNEASAFVIMFRRGDGILTMSSLVDRDRWDAFTASNLSLPDGVRDAILINAEIRADRMPGREAPLLTSASWDAASRRRFSFARPIAPEDGVWADGRFGPIPPAVRGITREAPAHERGARGTNRMRDTVSPVRFESEMVL
jgi:hypothetical protein